MLGELIHHIVKAPGTGGSEMIATRKDVHRRWLTDGRIGGTPAPPGPPPLLPPSAIRTANFFRPKTLLGPKLFGPSPIICCGTISNYNK